MCWNKRDVPERKWGFHGFSTVGCLWGTPGPNKWGSPLLSAIRRISVGKSGQQPDALWAVASLELRRTVVVGEGDGAHVGGG